MKTILVYALLVVSISVQAQDFKKGYALLESGSFAEGASFFKNYLTTSPDSANRTALLCYGRGIGLSGGPQIAQGVFQSLLKRFPNDLELQLNMAESLMWNRQFADAWTYYDSLLVRYPTNFNALLGCANALSSLHKFDNALVLIEKASAIDPQNANLKITRKYARLGSASELAQQQAYPTALTLLAGIFADFPDDIDAMFLNAQVFSMQENYADAQRLFEKLLTTPKRTDAYLQLAYLAFLQKKPRQALALARKAHENAPEADRKKTTIGIINALGWNSRFVEALAATDTLAQKNADSADMLLLRARLSVWGKQYQKGADFYAQALKQSPRSFDANLGYADARHAQGMDVPAMDYANRTLALFPRQPDAERFLTKLRLAHAPSAEGQFFVSQDNGHNTSTNYGVQLGYDLHTQFRLVGGYRLRQSGTTEAPNQAQAQLVTVGFRTRLTPFLGVEGDLSQINLHSKTQANSQLGFQVATEWRLGRWQQLTLRYNREPQTFTAGLIDYNLFYTNFMANYSLTTPFKLGFYGQAIQSQFSDRNQRQLFFASVYYDLSYQPVIKVGVNYQHLAFLQRVPRIYFSPFSYQSVELFGQAENLTMPKQRFLYQVTVAIGSQKIEDEDAQPTYRFSVSAGYRHHELLELHGYINRSNTASTTAVGYTYTEIGLKAKWRFLGKTK